MKSRISAILLGSGNLPARSRHGPPAMPTRCGASSRRVHAARRAGSRTSRLLQWRRCAAPDGKFPSVRFAVADSRLRPIVS